MGGVFLNGTVINTIYVTPDYQFKGWIFFGVNDRPFSEDIFHVER